MKYLEGNVYYRWQIHETLTNIHQPIILTYQYLGIQVTNYNHLACDIPFQFYRFRILTSSIEGESIDFPNHEMMQKLVVTFDQLIEELSINGFVYKSVENSPEDEQVD